MLEFRKWIAQETPEPLECSTAYAFHTIIHTSTKRVFFSLHWTKFQFLSLCAHNLIICLRYVNICSIWFEMCNYKSTIEFLDIFVCEENVAAATQQNVINELIKVNFFLYVRNAVLHVRTIIPNCNFPSPEKKYIRVNVYVILWSESRNSHIGWTAINEIKMSETIRAMIRNGRLF